MGRRIGAAAVLGVTLWISACSGSSNKSSSDGPVCTAGARHCVGSTVLMCAADGSAESIAETCDPTQACADGECVKTACVPNTKFCKEGAIWKCDSSGGGSTLSQMCAAGQFCLMDDDDADCSDTVCTAGEITCDGNVASKCKSDGSGPAPGGTDCAKSKQVCYQGKCQDQACSAGEKVCQHDDVYLCASSGTSMALLADCLVNEVCDAKAGTCRPRVCEPGRLDCDSTRVVKCNEFGSGWEQAGTDCAGQGQICDAGACKKQTCHPNATYCDGGNVYQCSASGVGSTLWQNCTADYYHCEEFPASNYAQCSYNQCQPGQLLCDGNYVKTCTANASVPATGTDCGSDNYCENGSCKPRVCTPYEYFCQNTDVYYCDDYGRASYIAQDCGNETTCQAQGNGGATCVTLPCEPGSTACVNNKIGTCSEDGSTLTKVTDDCTAAGNVCGPDIKCAKTVEEVLGVAEDVETDGAGTAIGDVIDVTSSRKLTAIEANLVLVAPRELRWVIFEQVGSNFVARIDKIMSNQTGNGYISSGPIDYTLKANKRYLLAVNITGGSYVALYDTAPWTNQNLSFGNPIGSSNFYYSATVGLEYYQERLYQLRVTTELP
jgi:hypothetical protein